MAWSWEIPTGFSIGEVFYNEPQNTSTLAPGNSFATGNSFAETQQKIQKLLQGT